MQLHQPRLAAVFFSARLALQQRDRWRLRVASKGWLRILLHFGMLYTGHEGCLGSAPKARRWYCGLNVQIMQPCRSQSAILHCIVADRLARRCPPSSRGMRSSARSPTRTLCSYGLTVVRRIFGITPRFQKDSPRVRLQLRPGNVCTSKKAFGAQIGLPRHSCVRLVTFYHLVQGFGEAA